MKNMRLSVQAFAKAHAVIPLLAASVLLFTLSGCRAPVGPQYTPTAQEDTGTLSLTINRQAAGRTILPETPLVTDFARIDLAFTLVNGYEDDEYFVEDWEYDTSISLGVGTWNLVVTAYLDEDGEYLVAQGSPATPIVVVAGEGASSSVTLLPITTGNGEFSWDLEFPSAVVYARMNIARIDVEANQIALTRAINLLGGLNPQNPGTTGLPAGRYRVLFTIRNAENVEATASAILRVYRNMESVLNNFRDIFDADDPFVTATLLDLILSSWDGDEWDFEENSISEIHFGLLGVEGTSGECEDSDVSWTFDDIVDGFNYLTDDDNAPANLVELKALVDAAILGVWAEWFYEEPFTYHRPAMNAIGEVVNEFGNASHVAFQWTNDGQTVTATIGGVYDVVIPFGFIDLPQLTGTVTITGEAVIAQTLGVNTFNLGGFFQTSIQDGIGIIEYRWQRGIYPDFDDIPEAASATYIVHADDAFYTIRVIVSRTGFVGEVISAATSIVEPPYTTVTNVVVSPQAPHVNRGTTREFSATVVGFHDPDQYVTWSIDEEDYIHDNTGIDADGELTIYIDEPLTSLTVRATSVFDNTQSGYTVVTIPPTVTGVTVTPPAPTVVAGESETFTATVLGHNVPDTTVTWSIDQANRHADTNISSAGELTVSFYETLGTLTVRATSVYAPSISGSATVTISIPPMGGTLAQQLAWIRQHGQAGNNYIVEIAASESINAADGALPSDRENLTITLRATVPSTINLLGNGSLFTVGPRGWAGPGSVHLILENNITLMGGGNNMPLVQVSETGTLTMNEGARIVGNTNNTAADFPNTQGGGVTVIGGTFVMHGGEISGNTSGGEGGGVRVIVNGTFDMRGGRIHGNHANGTGGGVQNTATFRMSGGTIYGHDAEPAALRNTSGGIGDALHRGSGYTASKFGTLSNGTFSSNGNFAMYHNATIRVVNGWREVEDIPDGTLQDRLEWLREHGQAGNTYVLVLNGDEPLEPGQRLPIGATIILVGSVPSEIVLSANGHMFYFETPNIASPPPESTTTLVLGNNITLVGRRTGGNGNVNNNQPVVLMGNRSRGVLIMEEGSRIRGNNNTNVNVSGGAVRVGQMSLFVMRGGEIMNNHTQGTTAAQGGGGVHVAVGNALTSTPAVVGGTFLISGGVIYGNEGTVATELRNQAQRAATHALFANQASGMRPATALYGTFENVVGVPTAENFVVAPSGGIFTVTTGMNIGARQLTLRVVNGVLQ